MFSKILKYNEVDLGKISLEVELQNAAYKHGFTPKITNVGYYSEEEIIFMEDLKESCIADKYGENPNVLPKKYWNQIRNILETLLYEEGIEYVDITPYNFIEKEDKIYIIDFGDAYYTNTNDKINWFLQDILDGFEGWNPDFK